MLVLPMARTLLCSVVGDHSLEVTEDAFGLHTIPPRHYLP